MKEQEINEGNKLIDGFMDSLCYLIADKGGSWVAHKGLVRTWQTYDHAESYMKSKGLDKKGYKVHKSSDESDYHLSYDELMPVVEKIESSGFTFIIEKNLVRCAGENYFWNGGVTNDSKLMSVYWAVVQFIKWHNQQNKK